MDESHIVQELQQSLRNLEVRVGRLEEEQAANVRLDVTAEEPQKENAPEETKEPEETNEPEKTNELGVASGSPGVASGCVSVFSEEKDARPVSSADDSVYYASLWVGMFGHADSIMTCVMLVLNVVMQFYFCALIAINLGSVDEMGLSTDQLESFLQWRLSVAHHVDHYDSTSDTSLASRVCDGFGGLTASHTQKDAFDNFDSYLGDGAFMDVLFGGPGLCLLALACWFCLVAEDLLSNFEFSYALLTISGRHTVIRAPYSIHHLNWKRVAVILFAVCLPRFAVSLTLFYTGALFLVHTAVLSDLILNAMALGFVLDLDNMLFTFLTPKVRSAVSNMDPLELKSLLGKINIAFVRPSFLLVTAVGMMVCQQLLLSNVLTRMTSAQDVLCGGNLQFVYVLDAFTGVSHHGETSESPVLDLSLYKFSAMLEQSELDGDVMSDLGNIISLGDWEFEGSNLSVDSGAATVRVMNGYSAEDALDAITCADTFGEFAYVARAREITGSATLTSCAELVDECDDSEVRSLCMATCGCASMYAGSYDRSGCSSTCDTIITEQVETVKDALYGVGEDSAKCDVQGDGWMETFVDELQATFVSDGTLEVVNGEYKWTSTFSQSFLSSTYNEYGLLDVDVDLPSWLDVSKGQGLCDAISFFDNLFLTDLCSTSASLLNDKGTLEGLCPGSCGLCGTETFAGTALTMSDLFKEQQRLRSNESLIAYDLFEELDEVILTCGSYVSGTTADETDDYGSPGADKTYSLVTDDDEPIVLISVCNDADFDTLLWVYTTNADGNLTLVADADDSDGCEYTSEVKLSVTGGETYLVVVDGYNAGTTGEFNLAVSCIPTTTTTTGSHSPYYSPSHDPSSTSSATGYYNPSSTSSGTGYYSPSSTSSATGYYNPSSTSSATGYYNPSSTSSASGNYNPSSTSSATAYSTPSSTSSATAYSTPSSTSSATAHSTPSSTSSAAGSTPSSTSSATAHYSTSGNTDVTTNTAASTTF